MLKLICTKTCSKCRQAVALMNDRGVDFSYREYRDEPLSADEIRDVLRMLGKSASDVFRKADRANKELGLTGNEPEEELIAQMAAHPTLLQRPIGIVGERAVVGRPPEDLLSLLE